jgi:hypothetical protein
MATIVNRRMFWALNHKVIPCLVVAQNLSTATVTVLLENRARHEVDAYDVRATEQDAYNRMMSLRDSYAAVLAMAYRNHERFGD